MLVSLNWFHANGKKSPPSGVRCVLIRWNTAVGNNVCRKIQEQPFAEGCCTNSVATGSVLIYLRHTNNHYQVILPLLVSGEAFIYCAEWIPNAQKLHVIVLDQSPFLQSIPFFSMGIKIKFLFSLHWTRKPWSMNKEIGLLDWLINNGYYYVFVSACDFLWIKCHAWINI